MIARALALVALTGLALGCERSHLRGEAGESCASRDDCAVGLRCVAAVCVDGDDAGAIDDGPVGEGVVCAARRDCLAGLACIDARCTMEPSAADGDRHGERGESCEATNDCAPDLACVQQTCREVALPLGRTPKSCHRVECAETEECCAGFVPNANCAAYMANCAMDPIFCNTYRSLCECNQTCEDELCVASAPGCSTDAECTSLQTPFCVGGTCRQCAKDAQCPGAGAKCLDGVCSAPCARDEECALLEACREGECVEVGCQTDRECAFLLRDARAVCREGDCRSPCARDVDCRGTEAAAFEVCVEGECIFVGCETDAECRALLGLEDTTDGARAVCK